MAEYTPAQAAAVTGLPLAAVHKAIDNRLFRPSAKRSGAAVRRLLTKEQVIFLQLEADGLRLLPLGARRKIAALLQQSPRTDQLTVGDGTALRVEISPARRKVESQLKQLARIEQMVVSDPEIMRGTPVFKGTRIPVDMVANMLAQDTTVDEILEGYPALDREKIAMAPVVHAGVSAARPPQPPLAWKEAARQTILPTEGSADDGMRFLVDECLHESLVGLAHAAGFDATHVNHLGLSGQPDWALAGGTDHERRIHW